MAIPTKSPISLAVIGHNHFGNPIPQEWYAAAKELIETDLFETELAPLLQQLAEEKAGRAASNSVAETRLGEIGDLREQLKSHEVAYAAVLETAREMEQRLELAEQQLHGVDMAGKLTSGDLFMLNMTVRILEEAYLGALVGERLRGIIGKLTAPVQPT